MDSLYPSSFENTSGKSLMDRNSCFSAPWIEVLLLLKCCWLGTHRGAIPEQLLIFSGVIPEQGESTATAKSSECCGKHQARNPNPTAAHFHTLNHSKEKLELPIAPYQGILTGLSRAGQCNLPLSGTHRSGCTWLLLPAFCWILQGKKSTNVQYILSKLFPVYPSCWVSHFYC